MRDDGKIFSELLFELVDLPTVVHPFVESPRKLRRDRLRRDTLPGNHCEDEEKFNRRLRRRRDAGIKLDLSATFCLSRILA
jgi:hypothetical protein